MYALECIHVERVSCNVVDDYEEKDDNVEYVIIIEAKSISFSFGLHGNQREPVHNSPCEVYITIEVETIAPCQWDWPLIKFHRLSPPHSRRHTKSHGKKNVCTIMAMYLRMKDCLSGSLPKLNLKNDLGFPSFNSFLFLL